MSHGIHKSCYCFWLRSHDEITTYQHLFLLSMKKKTILIYRYYRWCLMCFRIRIAILLIIISNFKAYFSNQILYLSRSLLFFIQNKKKSQTWSFAFEEFSILLVSSVVHTQTKQTLFLQLSFNFACIQCLCLSFLLLEVEDVILLGLWCLHNRKNLSTPEVP